MKRFQMFTVLSYLITAATATAAVDASASARQAYQQGLFLQRSQGDLSGALAAYDQALQAAGTTEDGSLREALLLRRGEIFELTDQAGELEGTMVALQKSAPGSAILQQVKYFPPELDLLVYLNITKLWNSPLMSALNVKGEIKSEDLDKLVPLIGFDPFQDLHEIIVGASLDEDEAMPVKHWLIQVRGNIAGFQPNKLIESHPKEAKQFMVKNKTLHGNKTLVFRIPLDQDPKKMMTVGMSRLDDHTVWAGDLKSLKRALAARAGKAPGLRANRKLAALTEKLPSSATFWVAVTPERILSQLEDLKGIPGMPDKMPEIEGVTVTGTFDADLSLAASVWAGDQESARLIGDVLRGFIALAQLAPMKDPLARRAIQSLRVASEGKRLSVSVQLPGKLLQQAARKKAHHADMLPPVPPVPPVTPAAPAPPAPPTP